MKNKNNFKSNNMIDIHNFDSIQLNKSLSELERLPESFRKKIMPLFFYRKYQKREFLFMKGDRRDRIYYLLSGYVKLEDIEEEGTLLIFDVIKPSQFFPYIGLFQDSIYKFFAEAISEVEVFYIDTEKFEKLLLSNDEMLIKMIPSVYKLIYQKEIRFQKLMQSTATERVRQTIGYLIETLGEQKNDGLIYFPVMLTTSDLAAMAGTSRVTVSNTLKQYYMMGKIERKNGHIVIRDRAFFSKNDLNLHNIQC